MKLTFDEALQDIADGRRISAADIQTRALRRVVWRTMIGLAGCYLPDDVSVYPTKRAAIDALLSIADDNEGVPRGMATSLRRLDYFDAGGYVYSVEKTTLRDCLG